MEREDSGSREAEDQPFVQQGRAALPLIKTPTIAALQDDRIERGSQLPVLSELGQAKREIISS
jgi:hypothetical protein